MRGGTRQAKFEVAPLDSTEFLQLVRQHSFTDETGSTLCSQLAHDLRDGSGGAGVLGLTCCGALAGAVSYSHTELEHCPGSYAARLDVVLTLPHCRGRGIGALLMAALFLHSVDVLGERLIYYSTIALHPSVERFVTGFGFTGIGAGQAPLYSIELDASNRSTFIDSARKAYQERMRGLRMGCIECMRRTWSTPWCLPRPSQEASA